MIYKRKIFFLCLFIYLLILTNCFITKRTDEDINSINNQSIEKNDINISDSVIIQENILTSEVRQESIQRSETENEKIRIPGGITSDISGNLYVIDAYDNTIKIIDNSGTIKQLVKIWNPYGNGPPLPPNGIAVDTFGNIYITINLHVMKIDNSLKISILMEDGIWENIDVNGTPFAFTPHGITADNSGNVYITTNREIIKINNSGIVNILKYTDIHGLNLSLSVFNNIAVDDNENLYMVESSLNRVIKLDNSGIVNVLAGGNYPGGYADGQGKSAQFNNPGSIALDSSGNIYVIDNYCIRKIDSSGMVSTLAGDGSTRGFVDGELASAQFDRPWSISIDGLGNIYFIDNIRIRKIDSFSIVSTLVIAEY